MGSGFYGKGCYGGGIRRIGEGLEVLSLMDERRWGFFVGW